MLQIFRELITAEQLRQSGAFIDVRSEAAYFTKLGENAEFITHVKRGEVAGFVAFYCNDYVSKCLYITLILVKPECRGEKIASGLIGSALVVARERGFSTCSLQVKKNNNSAISLYRKLGFLVVSEDDTNLLMSAEI